MNWAINVDGIGSVSLYEDGYVVPRSDTQKFKTELVALFAARDEIEKEITRLRVLSVKHSNRILELTKGAE